MKILKKLLSVVLTSTMVVGMSIGAFATDKFNEEDSILQDEKLEMMLNQQINRNFTCADSDYEIEINVLSIPESVEAYKQRNNVTTAKALSMVQADRAQGYYETDYFFRHNVADCSKFKVEAGASVKTYSSGSFFEFIEVLDEWSSAVGSGEYKWDEFYVDPVIESPQILTIACKGAVIVDTSIGTSVSGGALVSAGFSQSSTYIYRYVDGFSKTWNYER